MLDFSGFPSYASCMYTAHPSLTGRNSAQCNTVNSTVKRLSGPLELVATIPTQMISKSFITTAHWIFLMCSMQVLRVWLTVCFAFYQVPLPSARLYAPSIVLMPVQVHIFVVPCGYTTRARRFFRWCDAGRCTSELYINGFVVIYSPALLDCCGIRTSFLTTLHEMYRSNLSSSHW